MVQGASQVWWCVLVMGRLPGWHNSNSSTLLAACLGHTINLRQINQETQNTVKLSCTQSNIQSRAASRLEHCTHARYGGILVHATHNTQHTASLLW
jgi:starvation-inducible outer membrane lipoprotein